MTEEHPVTEIAAGFDAFSLGYAAGFTDNRLATEARRRAHDLYARWLGQPPGLIADIGCGPGTDARWLAECGFRLVAVDCSPGMVTLAGKELADVASHAGVVHLGDAFAPGFLRRVAPGPLDGAILGFGTLNCVPNLARAFGEIHGAVRPGSPVVVSSLSSRCIWDLLWHGLTGQGIATRWRRPPCRVSVGGVDCPMWFWTAADLCRAAQPFFAVADVIGVGSVSPPPYADRLLHRHPRLFRTLCRLDRRVERRPLAVRTADMVWVVLHAV